MAMIRRMAQHVLRRVPGGLKSQWQTPPTNHNAIRFYEALGARRKDKARFYFDRDLVLALGGLHAQG
jgi:hypothetical protein